MWGGRKCGSAKTKAYVSPISTESTATLPRETLLNPPTLVSECTHNSLSNLSGASQSQRYIRDNDDNLMLQVTTQYTPESPSHLIYCGKLEQAARSLQWLRGDTVDVSRELATIQINVQRSRQEKVRLSCL